MNVIENDVRALVDKELTAANERFPQFHSAHEGYAVILEEVEECEGEFDAMQYCLNCLWRQTKCNVPTEPKELQNAAVRLACEAIQVAAMCRKFMGMEGKGIWSNTLPQFKWEIVPRGISKSRQLTRMIVVGNTM